jgi:thiol-disulfide isomerase/thioredoxin
MNKKKQKPLSILLFNLLILTVLLFPYNVSFPQPLLNYMPKDIVKTPLPKLLDFGAGKCIPCKAMAPILQELSEEYKGRVIVRIIEIYDERELTRANRIRLIPTQIFFDSKNRAIFRH